jgi:hypothetical protein
MNCHRSPASAIVAASKEGRPDARALLLTTLVVSTLALLVSGWTAWSLHRSQSPQRIIEARGLIIHDGTGQPRVILGAPVPDPLSRGRTQGRAPPPCPA